MSSDLLVKFFGITKQFPGVKALDNISFDVRKGEVHSIVGENGAGKSTLMNILSGVYQPTSGTLYFEGKPVKFKDPRDAQEIGIAMIYQELSVAPKLNVMENIFIGRLKKNKFGLVDYKSMRRLCADQLNVIGNRTIKPDRMVRELSISERQVVEIAKALSLNAKLIIMDEPTSSLTKSETEKLLQTIRSLSEKGVSILFISHRMEEVFRISDRITVFRDGQYIKTLNRGEADSAEIISLMVGRRFTSSFNHEYRKFDENDQPILEVKNLTSKKLNQICFKLYRGEILALTGLVGAGRTELIQAIFGIDQYDSGEIYFENAKINIRKPIDALKQGFGLVPEGRKITGLFLNMSVRENIIITILSRISRATFLKRKKGRIIAGEYCAKLAVKTPGLEQKIKFLSGGNQQKCIIARWLMTNPTVLFLDEPTQGIDVGAKAEIYQIIDDLARQGVSIILVSSELPEVLSLADRILVMRSGEITAEILHEAATPENIIQNAIIV